MTTTLTQFAVAVNGNIQVELVRRGITQSALAERVGLSADQIRRRRQGKTAWTLDEIAVVAAFLEMSPSALTVVTTPEPPIGA